MMIAAVIPSATLGLAIIGVIAGYALGEVLSLKRRVERLEMDRKP